MKRIISIIVIAILIMMLCLLGADGENEGQEEIVIPEPVVDFPKTVPEPIVTRLDITIIDDMNDQVIKLENSVIQVLGELHIAEDSFNYSNTFVEGDRYSITIWIKVKK